jgi:transcriptional regulator with XRE-family HTH domain
MTGNDRGPRRAADVSAFGVALRRHRTNRGWSQEDLADATGGRIAVRTISDLERGVARRPRAETARLLAAALRLTREELAEFKAAARASGRPAATVAAAELTALAATGLAEASRRVAARPLIIVADPARLAEVGPLLAASDCLVLVTSGSLMAGQDDGSGPPPGRDARVVPLAAPDLGGMRRGLPA